MTPLLLAGLLGVAPAQPDDPLPAGAVFRAGTARYRTSGFYPRVFFTADADTLAVANSGDRVRFMDVPTGRDVGEVALPGGSMREAAASAKGDRLAVLGTWQRNERTKARPAVWLIDTAARKVLWRGDLPENNRALNWHVRVSADGSRVATAVDTDLRVWDADTAEELAQVGSRFRVMALDLSPDGAAVAFRTDAVRAWRWETDAEPRTVAPPSDNIFPVLRFTRDGRSLLLDDGTKKELGVWDVATARRTGGLPVARWASPVELSPDGKTLAAADRGDIRLPPEERAVRLIEVATGRELARLPVGLEHAYAVAWSADGRRVAAATWHRIHVWDAATHRPLGSAPPGHEGYVYEHAFLADGSLVTAGGDGTVRTWDATGRAGRVLRAGFEGVRGLAVAADGSLVAGYDMLGDVRVWDAKTGAAVAKAPAGGRGGAFRRLAFTADGPLLAVGADATLRVIDARTGRVAAAHALAPPPDPNADERTREWAKMEAATLADSVAFSPGGTTLAVSVPAGVRLLDARTGAMRRELAAGPTRVERLAFSPDGRRLAVAHRAKVHVTEVNGRVPVGGIRTDDTHAVELWDIADGKKLWTATADGQAPQQVAFSSDGTWVAETAYLGKDRNAVCLWDAATGADAGRLTFPGRPGYFAFDRTGRRVAVAFHDTTAVVFDVAAIRVRP